MFTLKHIPALTTLVALLTITSCGQEEAETDNTPVSIAVIGSDY